MQVLQPMQPTISRRRPSRAFEGRSGSVISARVMPSASALPAAMSRSATSTSIIREVAIRGGPSANGSVFPAIAASSTGGGGTIPTEPRYVAESPSASER